jgi:HTH-type transcriptional regulator/antitoxin HigA
MRKTSKSPRVAPDAYFQLVQKFPLRTIKSDDEHVRALTFLTKTSMQHQATIDKGVLDYLETLAHLIEDYEKHVSHELDLSGLSPVSAISHLMEVHGLNVSQMAAVMGTSQGTLSEIRSGGRGVSKQMIRKLVDRFGVDARIFL